MSNNTFSARTLLLIRRHFLACDANKKLPRENALTKIEPVIEYLFARERRSARAKEKNRIWWLPLQKRSEMKAADFRGDNARVREAIQVRCEYFHTSSLAQLLLCHDHSACRNSAFADNKKVANMSTLFSRHEHFIFIDKTLQWHIFSRLLYFFSMIRIITIQIYKILNVSFAKDKSTQIIFLVNVDWSFIVLQLIVYWIEHFRCTCSATEVYIVTK